MFSKTLVSASPCRSSTAILLWAGLLLAGPLEALPEWTLSAPVEVTTTDSTWLQVATDLQTGDAFVLYGVAGAGGREIRARGFDEKGLPLGGELTLLAEPNYQGARLQRIPGGNWIVAWVDSTETLRARCTDPAGSVTGGPWVLEPGSAANISLGDMMVQDGLAYLAWHNEAAVQVQGIDCVQGPQGQAEMVATGEVSTVWIQLFAGAAGRQVASLRRYEAHGEDEWVYWCEISLRSSGTGSFAYLGRRLCYDSTSSLTGATFAVLPGSDPGLAGYLYSDGIGETMRMSRTPISLGGAIGGEQFLPVASWSFCQISFVDVVPVGEEVAVIQSCDYDLMEGRILSRHGAPYSQILPFFNPPTFKGVFGRAAPMPNGNLAVAWTRPPEPGFGTHYLQFVRRDPGLLSYDGFETGNLVGWTIP